MYILCICIYICNTKYICIMYICIYTYNHRGAYLELSQTRAQQTAIWGPRKPLRLYSSVANFGTPEKKTSPNIKHHPNSPWFSAGIHIQDVILTHSCWQMSVPSFMTGRTYLPLGLVLDEEAVSLR